jgi:hypothetical protein
MFLTKTRFYTVNFIVTIHYRKGKPRMKYSLLTAVIVAVALSACGKKEEAAPAVEAPAAMAPAAEAPAAPAAEAPAAPAAEAPAAEAPAGEAAH